MLMCLRSCLVVYPQLFTDISSLGNGTLPYEGVPLDGRLQLYYNSNITLKSPFSNFLNLKTWKQQSRQKIMILFAAKKLSNHWNFSQGVWTGALITRSCISRAAAARWWWCGVCCGISRAAATTHKLSYYRNLGQWVWTGALCKSFVLKLAGSSHKRCDKDGWNGYCRQHCPFMLFNH